MNQVGSYQMFVSILKKLSQYIYMRTMYVHTWQKNCANIKYADFYRLNTFRLSNIGVAKKLNFFCCRINELF